MAVASSMLYGVADFLGGMGSRRGPAVTVTAWFQVVGLLFLVGYAGLAPGVTRPSDLVWGGASGVAGGIGVLLLYRVLASGVVSTAAPLISMIALTVPVAAGLARGERPGLLPLLGVVAGAIAVVLIAAHGETPAEGGTVAGRRERGGDATPVASRPRMLITIAPAVASGIAIGFFLVLLGQVQPGASGWPLVSGRAMASLTLCAMLFASRAPLTPPAATRPFIAGAALTDVSANVFYLLAVQRAPMSLIATLVSLAPATTVLLAQLVLRERLAPAQKVGVAVALVAVVLLAQG
jgi:drug/metabolite transporter (DMT)-like permease